MGRYRLLMAALVQHSNIVQRACAHTVQLNEQIALSPQEWQVFEYIIEHQNDDSCMNSISERLGIAQSTFSKVTKVLCGHGLVEKYQAENNRKNIILRPSPGALTLYRRQVATRMPLFQDFFDTLDPLTDEQIALFVHALTTMNQRLQQDNHQHHALKLIRKS